MTTTAMTVYKKKPLVKVIDVHALPARRRKRSPALDAFTEWITPWFRDCFEDSLPSLVKEMRGYYKNDREFRGLVNKGERGAAKRLLKQLMGCID